MTVLESQFEEVADAIDAGEVNHYEYDLKFDIVLKEAGGTVQGKALLDNTFHVLQQAIRNNELIEFFDVDGNQFHPERLNGHNDKINEMFCTEVGGPESKTFMFGLKIQTTVPYSTLKDRIQPALLANKTYMKIHHGGFAHGVNWNQLGFFVGKHPGFVDKPELAQHILEKFSSGWKTDKTYWTKDRKKELQEKLNTGYSKFDPMSVPMVILSTITSAKYHGKEIRAQTATLMIPFKFYRAGTNIMDYLLIHAKSVSNFIPHALKREDENAYATILNSHTVWMNDHRNLQITNIPNKNDLKRVTGRLGLTLEQVISKQESVLDMNYDRNRQRVNISTTSKNFSTLYSEIGKAITKHDFTYNPALKQVTIKHTTDESSVSTKSRYSTALSGIISMAGKQPIDEHTTQTKRSPWQRRTIPSIINFTDPNPNAFPPLPLRDPPPFQNSDNTSETQDTVATNATTLSMSVFQETLAKTEENHRREIAELKSVFQTELALLKQQLSYHQTHTATNSTTSTTLEAKLDLIMQHLQLNIPPSESNTASPPRKRRDQSSTPTPTKTNKPRVYEEDQHYPETSLNWDSDEADDDDPSSRDDAMALSGSEY